MFTRLVWQWHSLLKLASTARKVTPSILTWRTYSSQLSLQNAKVQSYIESLSNNPELMLRGSQIHNIVKEISANQLELAELAALGKGSS